MTTFLSLYWFISGKATKNEENEKFGEASFEDFYSGSGGFSSGKGLNIDYHLVGANPVAPWFVPEVDVDVKADISFWKNDDGSINVKGSVKGDRFPANENYLVDKNNNMLILGVSGINSEKANAAPYTELPGDKNRAMSEFYFTILFNKDETFKGVKTANGKEYNLNDWNKQFKELNPQSKKTGTKVTTITSDKNNLKSNYSD